MSQNHIYFYCYFGAKQLLCLWLFGRQTISIVIVMLWDKTTSRFTVSCEPNNIYFYGYLGAKQLQCGSQATIKGATSGTSMCFLQTNLVIFTWFMEPSSFCFEDYVWSKTNFIVLCDLVAKQPLFVLLLWGQTTSMLMVILETKQPLF